MGLINLSDRRVMIFTGEVMMTEGLEEVIAEKAQELIVKIIKEKGYRFAKKKKAKRVIVKNLRMSINSKTLKAKIQQIVNRLPTVIGSCSDYYKDRTFNYYGTQYKVHVIPIERVRSWLVTFAHSELFNSREFEKLYHSKKFGDYFIGELINDFLKELEINISKSHSFWGSTKNVLIDCDKNFDWYIKDETGHYYFVETFFGVYDEKESLFLLPVKVYEEINIKLGGLSEEEIKKIRDSLLEEK